MFSDLKDMTLVALTGAISHISMGATMQFIPMLLVIIFCVIAAYLAQNLQISVRLKG